MCGLLCVRSRQPIDTSRHLQALSVMKSRGPDFTVWRHENDIFLGQTVLHFAGSTDVYHDRTKSMLAFNGEIYDYADRGPWDSDTRLVKYLVQHRQWRQMADLGGPWAWIWTDFQTIEFATDPQHERHLWIYQDEDLLIVSSEITAIQQYVQIEPKIDPWISKHLAIRDHTPWSGIVRARPGYLYRDGQIDISIATMADWVHDTPDFEGTFNEAVEELDGILGKVCQDITRTGPVSMSYSGGLDSSLLTTYLPDAEPVTVVIGDKDPVAASLGGYFVDESHWADAYVQLIDRLHLPPLSWNWVSFYLVAKHSQHRAVISGTGADELFGGYPYNITGGTSDYHRGHEMVLTEDPRQNSLILDYIIQSGSVDLLGLDLVAGCHGREARAPFVHPRVIRFALSLPYDYKVSDRTKHILRALYTKRTGKIHDISKQGFAGHCNDSIRFIRPDYRPKHADRHQAWKTFLRDDFLQRFQSPHQDA